ncbi:hypothetical protein L665_01618 [Ralstonia solanacearum SD54]|nr:hypothetical protein F504_4398 [Ralstonia pseudosolanacearum FQY_4]ESS49556.1 hypothetical protein L665_01618 [Ralstonia solanacearum SD54]
MPGVPYAIRGMALPGAARNVHGRSSLPHFAVRPPASPRHRADRRAGGDNLHAA